MLSALAMGIQSAAIRRLEVSGIATTDITGTLTNLMAQLMRHRDASKRSFQHGLLLERFGSSTLAERSRLRWAFPSIRSLH